MAGLHGNWNGSTIGPILGPPQEERLCENKSEDTNHWQISVVEMLLHLKGENVLWIVLEGKSEYPAIVSVSRDRGQQRTALYYCSFNFGGGGLVEKSKIRSSFVLKDDIFTCFVFPPFSFGSLFPPNWPAPSALCSYPLELGRSKIVKSKGPVFNQFCSKF